LEDFATIINVEDEKREFKVSEPDKKSASYVMIVKYLKNELSEFFETRR
jgi:hypothetical protein